MSINDNPLLNYTGLPPFNRIKPEHVEPAIDTLLQENRAQLQRLLANNSHYTWDNLLRPLDDMEERLHRAWSPVCHLHAVADNEALRSAYNACLPKLSDYATELGQNRELFNAYKCIAKHDEFSTLSAAQQKIITNALRDFRLAGVDLPEDKQQRYRKIQQGLARLQTTFEENLLDATQAWGKHITDVRELAGLPDSALALAAQNARDRKKDAWLFTLDLPSYMPVMQYADNAGLRQEMYEAYVTRASDKGPNMGLWDNSQVMRDILKLRTEKAQLLGYNSYADYSLVPKMADNPQQVMDFLMDLAKRSHDAARRDFAELAQFAKEVDGKDRLEAWDVAYYSEKLCQKRYGISQKMLRPYFPVNRVLTGLFSITERLYGVIIKERKGVTTWHDDVQFFDIFDTDNEVRGSFYLDLYARQHKRGGAWMDECLVRRKTGGDMQRPVAYLTCNFTPPIVDNPALITHDEVITLFHEFGHGLHHMLTRIEYSGVSGINGVPWDAVELPSQLMENWCWEKGALDLFARHVDSGATINDDLFAKISSARNFQAGMQMVRQLEFALFDLRLHMDIAQDETLDIQKLLDDVRATVAVVPIPEFNRFQHGFSHIFAGGYGAGYYSYKWAEVLSADAFSRFEEEGIFNRQTSKEFLQTILEQGGSREPLDLFIEFRGHEPSIEPLLRHSGITP